LGKTRYFIKYRLTHFTSCIRYRQPVVLNPGFQPVVTHATQGVTTSLPYATERKQRGERVLYQYSSTKSSIEVHVKCDKF